MSKKQPARRRAPSKPPTIAAAERDAIRRHGIDITPFVRHLHERGVPRQEIADLLQAPAPTLERRMVEELNDIIPNRDSIFRPTPPPSSGSAITGDDISTARRIIEQRQSLGGPAAVSSPKPEIDVAFSLLVDKTERLVGAVHALVGRLDPVMHPASTEPTNQAEPASPQTSTAIGGLIVQQALAIDAMTRLLRAAANRLEI